MDFSKKSGFLADGKICPMDFEKQYCQNPPWGGFQQYCFSKSIGICCGILKNSTVKIRPEADFKIHPAVLLCQNPSPGTSGYLEKILPSGLQNLPSGRLRTALGQILESLGQDFFQNPLDRGWIFYHNPSGRGVIIYQSAMV